MKFRLDRKFEVINLIIKDSGFGSYIPIKDYNGDFRTIC